jgi:hypothetical protein
MLLIRNTIRHDGINLQPLTTVEAVAVVVRSTQHNDLRIISGYVPPTTPLSEAELEAIFTHMTPTVLFGDLNAKHAAWNCSSTIRLTNYYTFVSQKESTSTPLTRRRMSTSEGK